MDVSNNFNALNMRGRGWRRQIHETETIANPIQQNIKMGSQCCGDREWRSGKEKNGDSI
jgi:hypothetical protein